MGSAYYDSTGVSPEKRKDDLQVLSLCTWAFVRSMKRHLSPADEDEEDFRTELLEKLPGPQALKIIRAAHRPNRALQDLSTAIENLPMHFMRKNEVHKAVTIFEGRLFCFVRNADVWLCLSVYSLLDYCYFGYLQTTWAVANVC